MGSIFVIAAWGFIGVVAGSLCFGVLALLSLLFHGPVRRKALVVSGVISGLIGLSILVGFVASFFVPGLKFLFAAWSLLGVAAGSLCFGVLALLSLLFHGGARRKAFIVSGVISGLVGLSIPVVFLALLFLPDNPSADFHAIFDRDPANDVVIIGSTSSAGTDFGRGTVEFKVRGELLDELVGGWHPGRVSLDTQPGNIQLPTIEPWPGRTLPGNIQLSPIQPCKKLEVFFDNRRDRDWMLDYRAVAYCRERGLARGTYYTLDWRNLGLPLLVHRATLRLQE
jgi:hypothetical protein